MKRKILIVDDEPVTRRALERALSPSYDCLAAPDAEAALKLFDENQDVAVVLSDYKMEPGMNGVDLIREIKRRRPSTGCLLITAFGEIDLAVEAMQQGADDFITKPVTDLKQLEVRIEKAIGRSELEKKVAALEERLDGKIAALDGFTGASPAMERLYALIRQVAPSNATVLIEGPSGTGKELAARAIHNLSRRANGPFVAVECSALSENVLEAELFGSVKGGFTDARDRVGRFEAANGGTLFLDEIGEIPLSMQVKLLRTLESRTIQRVGDVKDIPVDFRLVTATNKSLAALVTEGKFREDLYYRLNVIEIHTPALKDHPEDIALIAARFVHEFSTMNGGRVTGIDPELVKALEAMPWPGNVRQLRNLVERMVVLSQGGNLTIADLPPGQQGSAAPAAPSPRLADTEKEQILSALKACGGNKSKAAQMLGVSRRTIHRKLAEWGMA